MSSRSGSSPKKRVQFALEAKLDDELWQPDFYPKAKELGKERKYYREYSFSSNSKSPVAARARSPLNLHFNYEREDVAEQILSSSQNLGGV